MNNATVNLKVDFNEDTKKLLHQISRNQIEIRLLLKKNEELLDILFNNPKITIEVPSDKSNVYLSNKKKK